MGKPGEEHSAAPSAAVDTQASEQNAEVRFSVSVFLRFRCVLALVLGVSVLLSAVFWLPPFFRHGDQGDPDLDNEFGDHDIIATFMLEKPISFLEDNVLRLAADILDEIGVPTTKVDIISLQSSSGANKTSIIFAVDPNGGYSEVSPAAKSLIKASFVSLVLRQSSLRLTASLFGDPFSFQVLKFVGGITISPPQSAFPLQKVQILFNFTLNFSIDQIQDDFEELTRQLKSGLHLVPYENLYISLTNSKGSTVAPPTTLQSSVLLAVGSTPSKARLKQLAQTITGHKENLGLNNTEFGRVKQVRLSSILQHSLNGGNGGPASSPAPSPLPRQHHKHHYSHSHRHNPSPSTSPAPAVGISEKHIHAVARSPIHAPQKSHGAKPPNCHFGEKRRFFRNGNKGSPLFPPVEPPASPPYTSASPQMHVLPPAPVPRLILSPSRLPNVAFGHARSPLKDAFDKEPPDISPSNFPLHSSSGAGAVPTDLWALVVFLVLA